MSLETGLRTLWLAEASITVLLGSATKGVYLNTADQKAVQPYVVYRFNDTDHQDFIDQAGSDSRTPVRVECFAELASEAVDVRDAIYDYMKNFSGTAGDQTVHSVIARKAGTDFEQPWDASDRGLHVMELMLDIAHRDT